MRAREGAKLYDDLYGKSRTVEDIKDRIARRAPEVVEEYRVKLTERIEKMLGSVEVDRARLATEVALFADKAGIDEEIVRLTSYAGQR